MQIIFISQTLTTQSMFLWCTPRTEYINWIISPTCGFVNYISRAYFSRIFFCVLYQAIKEMRSKKAAGDDDVPGDLLKLLGKGGLKIITKLINTIYENGEWPKDLTEVSMIALKKKPQATKFSNHRTISLIAHTAKIVAKIPRRRIEKKI